jgi:hypothetical protein
LIIYWTWYNWEDDSLHVESPYLNELLKRFGNGEEGNEETE